MPLASHYEPLLGPEWSSTGIFFLVIISCYSCFVLFGISLIIFFGVKERGNYSPVRIRGLFVTTSAVVVLHGYITALCIVYQLNDRFTCRHEFWIMNTLLPAGVALFQAANLRLFTVARRQDEGVETGNWAKKPASFALKRGQFQLWLKQSSITVKVYSGILVALFFQVCLTFLLYYGSRRFNPAIGLFGRLEDPLTCRRGLEWIPSVIWQFFWSWIIGPIVLWKSRALNDTLHFTRQTRLCVIASMPGAPLWILFLYAGTPRTNAVDSFIPPAMWFAPGLVVMQCTMIVYTILASVNKTPAEWKEHRYAKVEKLQPQHPFFNMASEWINDIDIIGSKVAFDYQLETNPQPLLEFAKREFAAENIDFLIRVKQWKRDFFNVDGTTKDPQLTNTYHTALKIYSQVIDALNLDMAEAQHLARVFGDVTRTERANSLRSIAPFNGALEAPSRSPMSSGHFAYEINSRTSSLQSNVSGTQLSQAAACVIPISPMATAKTQYSLSQTKGNPVRIFAAAIKPAANVEAIVLPPNSTMPSSTSLLPSPPPELNYDVFDVAYRRIHSLAFSNHWARFVRSQPNFGQGIVEGDIAIPVETLQELVRRAKERMAAGKE